MPYIKADRRNFFDFAITSLVHNLKFGSDDQNRAGDLNYIITRVFKEVYADKDCYKTYNERIGVLECCKLELYRRAISEYENLKAIENGDV